MKALTVQQPWASLIAAGVKDVENRTWTTKHRGPLLIHAAKKVDRAALEQHRQLLTRVGLNPDRLPTSGIVGQVEIADVVRDSPSEWAIADHFHWLIRSPRCLPFRPCRGALGLWNDQPTATPPAQLDLDV